MSILTLLSGVPLYSTKEEALAWANANGVSGFHEHIFQGRTGYMGGTSHSVATTATQPITTTTTTTTTTSSGGGGGGGGY